MATFRTSDGLTLYYEVTGSGPPLLCLAGLTRNSRDFDPLRAALPGVQIITLDYRGRGLSEFDADAHNYNVLREARDAVDLIAHLGLGRVTLLGTSRGGLIAMAMAARHPETLSGVVLNDVGPEIGPAGIARIMEYLGQAPQVRDLDAAARQMQAENAHSFPGVPFDVWRQQAEAQFRATDAGLALRYDPRLRQAILEQAASEAAPDLWLFFDALKTLPVGLLRGANSDILLPETVAEMRRRHPGLIVSEVPDRGHVPFLDEPQSLDVIRAILAEAECLTLT
ncbi:alpha/beta fold hydrolase [Marinibacterium profundimaris]|uniref:Hydrolase n=1 Tax=Marinibacterium profundimaris TaxID=1679460 RepID=A0A225NFT2_9RHOB|nr:alpha/beta hydrolase [Marinibacterium profundimaris]OWU70556.1 hydrolase [Marinibacterium profundimaris]